MKRIFFLIASLFLLTACSSEDTFPCIQCDRPTPESELSDASPDEFMCRDCANAITKWRVCRSCEEVFIPDHGCSTDTYCISCAEENAATCCSCGELVDKFSLVQAEAEDGLFYYFCAPCAEDILAQFEIDYALFAESADPQP